MSGTKEGAIKSAATNKRRYGDDFYRNIGRKGGRNGHTGGFAKDVARARIAGAVGGTASRRNGPKIVDVRYKVLHDIPDDIVITGIADMKDGYLAKTTTKQRNFGNNERGKTYKVGINQHGIAMRILKELENQAYIQIISIDGRNAND